MNDKVILGEIKKIKRIKKKTAGKYHKNYFRTTNDMELHTGYDAKDRLKCHSGSWTRVCTGKIFKATKLV